MGDIKEIPQGGPPPDPIHLMKVASLAGNKPETEWGMLALDCDELGVELLLRTPMARSKDSDADSWHKKRGQLQVICFRDGLCLFHAITKSIDTLHLTATRARKALKAATRSD